MADTARRRAEFYPQRERNYGSYYSYEDGSAVRELEEFEPEKKRRKKQKDHSAALRARANATALNRTFVVFLAVVCLFTLVLCVTYLQQKATITTQNEEIAILESQYNKLKGDNDARYNQVVSSLTMEDVKDAALTLGLHYAGADQVQYYTPIQDSYVRQYKEVVSNE